MIEGLGKLVRAVGFVLPFVAKEDHARLAARIDARLKPLQEEAVDLLEVSGYLAGTEHRTCQIYR